MFNICTKINSFVVETVCVILNQLVTKIVYIVQEVETIFDHLPDILELSTQLQVAIEEMIEMSSEMEGPRTPPIGFCFEESAEVTADSFTYPL